MNEKKIAHIIESLSGVENDLKSGIRMLTEGSCSQAELLIRELGEELAIVHPRSHQELRVRLIEVVLGYEEELLFRFVWRDEDNSSRQLTLNLLELMESMSSVQGSTSLR